MASFLLLRLNQSIVLLVCLVPVLPDYALPNIFNYPKPHYYPTMTPQVLVKISLTYTCSLLFKSPCHQDICIDKPEMREICLNKWRILFVD